jgi:hypothetical protein
MVSAASPGQGLLSFELCCQASLSTIASISPRSKTPKKELRSRAWY